MERAKRKEDSAPHKLVKVVKQKEGGLERIRDINLALLRTLSCTLGEEREALWRSFCRKI